MLVDNDEINRQPSFNHYEKVLFEDDSDYYSDAIDDDSAVEALTTSVRKTRQLRTAY